MCRFLVGVLLIAFCWPTMANGQEKENEAGKYKLVWADEFNNEGAPDSANWNYEHGFVRNNEQQWYQKQNAVCHKGLLMIEARRENFPNPNYAEGNKNWKNNRKFIDYTSSSINTSSLHSWQYGRFTMRARIPVKPGMWPAFWALGVNKPWPSNGEIDIMEYYQGNLLANIAIGTDKPYKAKWYSTKRPIDSLDKNWASKFHIWRMDWDSEQISLYVDDTLLSRAAVKDLVNQDGSGFNPFMQPQYILLNLAVGGDNGGDPTTTKFPQRYEIDYVRVYQKAK
ncbi:glycoside hydrolase family 16 protein [Mucilaginibacter agri]|uniref:Family 16 glycosylhydrolase n=1 Tax=Mucilaginibacter agri TaxID=2695265 RepID=A0A966DWG4_9SPHI|nr:glycoside hydrolase family 16 protein [Mucilaginibacter agri]NCD72487.1 family 16 glycosylhydrolase [Mucilaginibacter agri]